ncbi:MAG: 50S ribosomal protein L11 methyltransferase [Thermoflexales bacterium]
MDRWLELSLETDAETAEAIHEALFPIVGGRVALEQLHCPDAAPADRWENEAPQGPVIVRAWLALDQPEADQTRARVERALAALRLIRPLPAGRWREVRQSDWAEAWRTAFHPLRIGERLLIRPSWIQAEAVEARPGDITIVLDPGMAFGTGLHPTTQLCALAMMKHIQADERVLDVGCGSGILSILAAKLGASVVLGVDTDAEAVRVSRENAALNGVADRVRFAHGSFELADQVHDWAIANILAPVIARLLAEGLANYGRRFIFSGILKSQEEQVRRACEEARLSLCEEQQLGDWVALVAQHAS